MLLSEEFLSKYPDFPAHQSELSKFVYYRTYSRWIAELNRRETWKETCARAVEYNCSLAPTSKEEAEALFHNMFNLKQFISGRSLWIGGTEAAKKAPLAGFNCSFVVVDKLKAFADLFYLLMVGTGVGFRILPEDVDKLPSFRDDVKLKCFYHGGETWGNPTTTFEKLSDKSATIVVGDSKEGWVTALELYLEVMSGELEEDLEFLYMDFSHIRPKGTPLQTFGGSSSGYKSVKEMFEKIHKVITEGEYSYPLVNGKLKPIHCLDICNIIGQNVVVGGVRRTAEIAIISPKDTDCINAKRNLTEDKYHRFMSNNSVYLDEKPTKEELKVIFESIRESGEPGFINAQEAKRRRPDFAGLNPCAEIILPPNAVCNLTTINLPAFVNDDGTPDSLGLIEALKLSARAGYRMTCLDLELEDWNEVHHRDRLLGCSMTGYQDFLGLLGAVDEEYFLLNTNKFINDFADEYADELGTPRSLLKTAVKPEGTLSLIANGVSPGLHFQHAPYFIRRIRVNASDPLAKTALKLGWRINPEVGQDMETATTLVIDFPCKSPSNKTKFDVSAVEQLDIYRMFQKFYTEQNTSNTITVRPEEWEEVVDYVYTHWDDILAVSFLELNSTYYPLLPYEECTKEEYELLKETMKPFDPDMLNNMEIETRNMGKEFEILDDREGCENGVCPIR